MPDEYVGAVMKLCQEKRGVQTNLAYHGRQVHLTYDLPLAGNRARLLRPHEVDDPRLRLDGLRIQGIPRLRRRARRHADQRGPRRCASLDPAPLDPIPRGREIVQRLRGLIPRQMYEVSIQAAIGANIIARENVKALRKNVLAKCYGGDITRKRKLLEKQKAGKKRMKQVRSG